MTLLSMFTDSDELLSRFDNKLFQSHVIALSLYYNLFGEERFLLSIGYICYVEWLIGAEFSQLTLIPPPHLVLVQEY